MNPAAYAEFKEYNELEKKMYGCVSSNDWKTVSEMLESMTEEGKALYLMAQTIWSGVIRARWHNEATAVHMYHYWLSIQ